METVVAILMLVICFNFALKQTFCKPIVHMASVLLCACFVGLSWPIAIEQSKTEISDWLQDANLMLNLSVVLTIEVVLQVAFCLLAAKLQTTGNVKPFVVRTYRLLRVFPGFLIFPVLFGLLVAAIFTFPGRDFATISWVSAVIVVSLFFLLIKLVKYLLPEKELRLEVLFLCYIFEALVGFIASVNGRTGVVGVSSVNISALFLLFLILVVGAVIGYLSYRWRGLLKRKSR